MRKSLSLFLFAITFSGCSHYYYAPLSQNVPLFKEKNECTANVSVNFALLPSDVNAQTAYAFTNHLALMANYQNANYLINTFDFEKQTYYDGALGYFMPLDNNGVVEVFAGYGKADQFHQFTIDETARLSFNKIFIQPAIAYKGNYFDLALSLNISRVSFNNISRDSINADEAHAIDMIKQVKNYYFFEPAITIRGGWKYIKVQGQLVLADGFYKERDYFGTVRLNVGLAIDIAPRYWKNKAKSKSTNPTLP